MKKLCLLVLLLFPLVSHAASVVKLKLSYNDNVVSCEGTAVSMVVDITPAQAGNHLLAEWYAIFRAPLNVRVTLNYCTGAGCTNWMQIASWPQSGSMGSLEMMPHSGARVFPGAMASLHRLQFKIEDMSTNLNTCNDVSNRMLKITELNGTL